MRHIWTSVLVLTLALTACAQPDPILGGPPVGEARLPDLVPDAPVSLRTSPEPDGRVLMLFTSTLVNVGAGDFVLSGVRSDTGWTVQQEIPYSESGAELVSVDVPMVWGGDQHEHWHVSRVAVYWLEAFDGAGAPVEDIEPRFDTKVGFCFFDSDHQLSFGKPDTTYDVSGCGEAGDDSFRMGLSRGWSDVYSFALPGQEIDITGLPDGRYRLWVEVDAERWFRESNIDNNITWADIDLGTRESDGARLALVVGSGPRPGD